MKLAEYLLIRSKGRNVKALSKVEAELFGLEWPLKKGWSGRYASVEIQDVSAQAIREKVQSAKDADRRARITDGKQKAKVTARQQNLVLTTGNQQPWLVCGNPGESACKICGVAIRWKQKRNGKWRVMDAHGGNIHKCAIPRYANKTKPVQTYKPGYIDRGVDVTSNEFLETYAWRRLRMFVLKRDGARCACCGATPADGAVMNVDHIKPRKLFPQLALDPDNLQILCGPCNHGKGNWDQTDWRVKA